MDGNNNNKSEARIRGSNFTKEEELLLLNIITNYKHIIECKNSNKITPQEKV